MCEKPAYFINVLDEALVEISLKFVCQLLNININRIITVVTVHPGK